MHRPKLLFVGAFPGKDRAVYGGMVTDCRLLMQSSLVERVFLHTIDSTQRSNPPPGLALRTIYAIRRFAEYLIKSEKIRPDAVLLFSSSGASLLEKGMMAWYARLRGVPCLIFPRGGKVISLAEGAVFWRFLSRLLLRGARVFLCQGPAWKKFATDVVGFAPDKAPIILNWTATPRLLEIGASRGVESANRAIRLLFVGWVEEEKGIFQLIEACARLADSSSFQLRVVGDGRARQQAQRFVEQNGLQNRVVFSGWLAGHSLEEAYAQADVFVLPSWYEGLPNSMVEAMAAKLAVVVTAVGAIPEVVSQGENCLVIPPRDVDALASALYLLINDAQSRARLAYSGFCLAKEQFAVDVAVEKLVNEVKRQIPNFYESDIKV